MKGPKKEKYLYRRGGKWWIKIPMGPGADPLYESTSVSVDDKNIDRVPREAIAYRDQKLAAKHRNELNGANGNILVDTLLDATLKRWQRDGKPSSVYAMEKVINAHIRPAFGKIKASRLTTAMLEDYRDKRATAGRRVATINRELEYLRVALKDGQKTTPPSVTIIPYFPMQEEDNARQGFLEKPDYEVLLRELKPELRPALILGYHLGLRLQEILHMRWDWFPRDVQGPAGAIDRSRFWIPKEIEKTNRGRGVPVFAGALRDCIEELWAEHTTNWPDVPWVVHRNGKRIVTLKEGWKQAVIRAKVPGLLFHDLRRSAVRNMDKAGVPRKVIMKIIGHVTESMFLRYRIVADEDMDEAGEKMAAYHAA